MVTKHMTETMNQTQSLILAKNHMVTKLSNSSTANNKCLILAKNHMVTKPGSPENNWL